MDNTFLYLAKLDAVTAEITYESTCSTGFGGMLIKGIRIPKTNYNPLGKLWASIRKRNCEKYGVSVTAIFIYDGLDSVISCHFNLDYGYQEENGIDQKMYEQRFEDTFDAQMETLLETLESFMRDFDNGYVPYLAHIEETNGKINEEFCDQMFNSFLVSKGLKTKADMEAKKERQAKLQELQKLHAQSPFNGVPWEK